MMDRDRELHEMADEGRALMNDYIKREYAYSACCYETPECYMARKEIKALPSADVAPIVRCKDCIYYQDNNDGYPHDGCRWRSDETPDATDFCSFGERKDNEIDRR